MSGTAASSARTGRTYVDTEDYKRVDYAVLISQVTREEQWSHRKATSVNPLGTPGGGGGGGESVPLGEIQESIAGRS